MNKRILVVGSANMDLCLNVYRMPEAGETVQDNGGVAYAPGGKGANAAVALARLGADCTFLTKLGKDAHGKRLYKYYSDAGMNTSCIKVDAEMPTGLAVVIREANGENRIIHYPGANTKITNDNILSTFNSASHEALYIGFEASFAVALSAARIAASRGIPIFVDAAPASADVQLDLLPHVEIFSPNETEAFEYTGVMPAGADSALRASLALYRRVKCRYVVIKQGARGACIYDGKHFDMVPAYKLDRVVDTTAAGDIFTAAMTLEYLRTADIKEAVKYGNAAAALSVSRMGSSSSAPTAEEVRRLITTGVIR